MIYLLARLLVAFSWSLLVKSSPTVDANSFKWRTSSSKPPKDVSSPSGTLQVYATTSRPYIAKDLPQGATSGNSYGPQEQTSSKFGAYRLPNGTASSSSYGSQGSGGTGIVHPYECSPGTGYAAVTSTQTVTTMVTNTQTVTTIITSSQTITSTQLSTVTQTSSTTTTITAYVTTTVTTTTNLNTGNQGLIPGTGGSSPPTNVPSYVHTAGQSGPLPEGTSQPLVPGGPTSQVSSSMIQQYGNNTLSGGGNQLNPQPTGLGPTSQALNPGTSASQAPYRGSSNEPFPVFGTKTSGFVPSGGSSSGGIYTSFGANASGGQYPASGTNPMASIAKGTGLPNSSNYQFGTAPPYKTSMKNSTLQFRPTGATSLKPTISPIGSATPLITSQAGVNTPINSNASVSAKLYNPSNPSHPVNASTTSHPIPQTCSSPSTATATGYFDGLPFAPLPTPYLSLNYTTFSPVNATPSEHLLSSRNPRKLSLPTIPDPETKAFTIGFNMRHLTVSCYPLPANLSCTVNIWGLEAPHTNTNGAAAAGIASMSILVPSSTVTGIVNGTVGENIARYGVGVPVDFTGAGWLGLTSLSFEAKIDGPWGTGDGRTGVAIDNVSYEAITCPE
ncbi:MAG: hypothetical protein Q9191_002408 [Dirinaria sp. TL-2023a]